MTRPDVSSSRPATRAGARRSTSPIDRPQRSTGGGRPSPAGARSTETSASIWVGGPGTPSCCGSRIWVRATWSPSANCASRAEMSSGDDALVARAVAGDATALNDLLRLHYDRVYAICLRMTGNEADALDACQEALMAIARGLRRFDQRSA